MILYVGTKSKSSWSLRPFLALAEAGAVFETRTIYLDTDTSRAELLAASPTGKVPALRDGDTHVWDSLAICEYVAEQYPALWPKERGARARARAVSAEMHSGFQALRTNMPMNLLEKKPGVGHVPEALADARRVMAIWGEALKASGGPFLFGAFSIADAMFAPVTTRFTTYVVEMDDTSRGYVERVQATAGFRRWLAEAREENAKDPKPLSVG